MAQSFEKSLVLEKKKKKQPHISLDILSEHVVSKKGDLQRNPLQTQTQEVTVMSQYT